MRRTLIRTTGVSMITAGLCLPAIMAATSPAAAVPPPFPPFCNSVVVDDLGSILTEGGGTASFAASNDGLVMNTPAQASKVVYRRTLIRTVPLSTVEVLSYVTDRQPGATGVDSTVAAYKLGIDTGGDGSVDGALVYEPYYNGTVTNGRETHNVLGANGSGKWWFSGEPENKQTLATMQDWIEGRGPVAFSAPEIVWFGVEQGTYNTGAVTLVTNVKFDADGFCTDVRFAAKMPTKPVPSNPPATSPTPAPTNTVTEVPPPPMEPTPTTTPTFPPPPQKPVPTNSTKPPTTAPTTTPPAAGGAGGADAAGGSSGGALPLTGPATAVAGSVGLASIAVGGLLLVLTRRRKPTLASA